MKTPMSRFQIHDDLTAPEGSVPVLRGALASGGQLPNFLGVLAGSPAALRAYARFRSELRHGHLAVPTLERIALAIAEHHGSAPGIALHSRTARAVGLGIDEVALAREFDSHDDPRRRRCCATSRRLVIAGGRRCTCTRRPARPAGVTSSSSRRSPPSPRELHRDDQCRRRGPDRRLRGGVAHAARRLSVTAPSPSRVS